MKWIRSVFELPPEIQVDLSFHLVEIAINYLKVHLLFHINLIYLTRKKLAITLINPHMENLHLSSNLAKKVIDINLNKYKY